LNNQGGKEGKSNLDLHKILGKDKNIKEELLEEEGLKITEN